MSESNTAPEFVYVKYEKQDGSLQIDRHTRPALLNPTEEIGDFVRDIVSTYKLNSDLRYLGLADEEEYDAFRTLQGAGVE